MPEAFDRFVDRATAEGRGDLKAVFDPFAEDATQSVQGIDIQDVESKYSKFHVEDLLRSCVERASSCLSLREQAAELAIRAFNEEADRQLQADLLEKTFSVEQREIGFIGPIAENSSYLRYDNGQLLDTSITADIVRARLDDHESINSRINTYYELLKDRSDTPGNPSRLSERISFLKEMFSTNLVEAFRRAIVCRAGLRDVYGIDMLLPSSNSSTFFEDFVMWLQAASDKLDEELDQRFIADVAFTFSAADETPGEFELLKLTEWNSQRAAQNFSVELNQTIFEQLGMAKPLMRSVRLQCVQLEATSSTIWPTKLTLPGNGTSVSTLAYSEGRDYDDRIAGTDVHNRSPAGTWLVKLQQPRALNHGALDKLTNLIVFIRVSYRGA